MAATVIRLAAPKLDTPSRAVKRYVKARLAESQLAACYAAAKAERAAAELALTGGQMAEARRLLHSLLPTS